MKCCQRFSLKNSLQVGQPRVNYGERIHGRIDLSPSKEEGRGASDILE